MTVSRVDVLVVGGANTDYLVQGPELPTPGATVEGEVFQEAPGGKGANQAVAAARLGAQALLVARIGNDSRGQAIVRRLTDEGVDTSCIVRDAGAPTGVALVMVDVHGRKQILTCPGANRSLTANDVALAASAMRNSKVVLVQLEVPLEAIETAVRLGRAAGARIVLDPAPACPLPEGLLRDVDVIRPNTSEAEVLTGVAVTDVASARRAAGELLRRGAGAACVAAPGGDLLVSGDGELWLPHLPVEVVDATGAGDAFAAALAVALADGQTLAASARFANAASALATTSLGAQAGLPRRSDVERLLATLDAGRTHVGVGTPAAQ